MIGKFLPYHRGHAYLISRATDDCDQVDVLICERGEDSIPGELRRAWVSRFHPTAEVHLVDQDAAGLADDDTAGWARLTAELVGAPDAVFTSEAYGDAYAAALGCVHVSVDPERTVVPVSGTAIRRDPAAYRQFLEPEVNSYFVRRVCIVGAESTGKTTLARDLAMRFDTLWVPEYGHLYQALGRPDPRGPWTSDEFVAIARMQGWHEDWLAGYAHGILFCDTDVHATAVWERRLRGDVSPEVERLGDRRYDLYVLPDLSTPFAQDEWRLRDDGPHRIEMHEAFRRWITDRGTPLIEPCGSRSERVEQVARALEALA